MFRNAWPITAVTCLLLCGGCDDDDHRRYGPSPPVGPLPVGTLELHWSIDGATDPAACDALGASDFEALLFNGYKVTQLEAPCSDFAAPMALYQGDYVARTRLVDVDDYSVTRRIVLDQLRILEDQTTSLDIDFPSELVAEPPEAEDAGVPPTVDEPDAAPPPDGGDAGAPPEEADAAAP